MGNTTRIKNSKEILENILDDLPGEKIEEIIDFAKFLQYQYQKKNNSQVDARSLLIQQKALSRIWDNPEEDIYDL